MGLSNMSNDEVVDVEARLVHETDKARLFSFDPNKDNEWLPKSIHEWDSNTQQVTMPEWMAIQRGLV